MLRQIGLRIRAVLRRGALEHDMREEMRAHLEQTTERLMARGMSRRDAELAARREFGNVGVHQENARDVRGGRWVESTIADVRFALRHFRRRRALTASVILVLALGLGTTAALVSMIQSVTMRPAPGVPDDDRLVRIRGIERAERASRRATRGFSPTQLQTLAAARETFTGIAGWATDQVTFNDGTATEPRTMYAQFVTPNFFTTLGVPPRTELGDLSVIIGDDLWERQFARDPRAVGRMVSVNGIAMRVAGIAPPRFHGPTPDATNPSLWIPLTARRAVLRSDSVALSVIARLAPGGDIARASAIARNVVLNSPGAASVAERGGDAVRLRGETDVEAQETISGTTVAFSTVTFLVLLVTCSNVSALLLGAAVGRRHEIAVRLSLGAGRRRIMRQLLTESALLALGGALAGVVLYWWITLFLATRMPSVDIAPDFATAAVTCAIAIVIGLLFGLSPALHATHAAVAASLRDIATAPASRSRLQRAFVIAQIVFSQPLLVVLAMILVVATPRGGAFPDDPHLMWARVGVWGSPDVIANREARLAEVARTLAAQPGVAAVVNDAAGFANVAVNPASPVRVHVEGAMPGYFAALGVSLLRGRDLAWTDTSARDAAVVVGGDFARTMWGGADPLGRRFSTAAQKEGDPAFVVVGVYDVTRPTTRGPETRIFTAQGKHWRRDVLIVRTAGPAAAAIAGVRKTLLAAPDLPVEEVATLADAGRELHSDERNLAYGAAGAGALALLLASIGLYGVVALAVGQRQREIGIRIALGASPAAVARSFFRSGVVLSAIALAVGLPITMLGVRSTVQFVGAPAIGTATVAVAVSAAVLAVASIASWIPARRATRVDPATTLREA